MNSIVFQFLLVLSIFGTLILAAVPSTDCGSTCGYDVDAFKGCSEVQVWTGTGDDQHGKTPWPYGWIEHNSEIRSVTISGELTYELQNPIWCSGATSKKLQLEWIFVPEQCLGTTCENPKYFLPFNYTSDSHGDYGSSEFSFTFPTSSSYPQSARKYQWQMFQTNGPPYGCQYNLDMKWKISQC